MSPCCAVGDASQNSDYYQNMGFIKGTLFVTTGLFRPTSKRERAQRAQQRNELVQRKIAKNAKMQTRALEEQNRLMSEQNRLILDAETSARQGSPTHDVSTGSPEPKMSKLDKLAALAKLHSSGILTDEEFASQKSLLLEAD